MVDVEDKIDKLFEKKINKSEGVVDDFMDDGQPNLSNTVNPNVDNSDNSNESLLPNNPQMVERYKKWKKKQEMK